MPLEADIHLELNSEVQGQHITVALETLGCKLNQAETESLAREFKLAGFRIVTAESPADIYVLNTCTVTHVADRKTRHCLRMARRRNPDCYIIVTGCYAERAEKALTDIEDVNLVINNERKNELVYMLQEQGLFKPSGERQIDGYLDRTRSFVKAQEGCNNFCTYCIVPHVRGREKSLTPEKVIGEISDRILRGYVEVVLTGTEIGRYNYQGLDLAGLIKRILVETNIQRLRISSIQPPEITPELVKLWNDPRLCRHFHLSLQSGSDSVLRRMKRCYGTAEYTEAVKKLRSMIQDVAITTDIITGFPGETPGEFEDSLNYTRNMEFARIHVFPFSPREGTLAARMPDQVDPGEKKIRSDRMLALAQESRRKFHLRFLNKTMQVLFEQAAGNVWSGYTDSYIKVYTESKVSLTNRIIPIKMAELYKDGVWGEIS